jgi:hypothetical protein
MHSSILATNTYVTTYITLYEYTLPSSPADISITERQQQQHQDKVVLHQNSKPPNKQAAKHSTAGAFNTAYTHP